MCQNDNAKKPQKLPFQMCLEGIRLVEIEGYSVRAAREYHRLHAECYFSPDSIPLQTWFRETVLSISRYYLQMYAAVGKLASVFQTNAAMSPKDLKALRLLMDHSRGLYGSEMVVLSGGFLGRGTIYTLLDRLVERGFVREIVESPTASLQMARTRHVITANGQRAVREYVEQMGLLLPSSAT